jgi:flagella synthesis protein FlgN
MTDLLRSIETEADAVFRFIDLLKQEQSTLTNGDVDSLTKVIEQKNAIAAELGLLAKQRNILLASRGLAPDRAGMEDWCARHPTNSPIRTTWSKILSSASEARELNRVNGELIQIRMQNNTQALEALLGASRSFSLYGPDGQTSGHSTRRINDAA